MRAVHNVHERDLAGSPAVVGALLDGIGSSSDLLWPGNRWPPVRLDRPLAVGAAGGHGPIRYVVDEYEPGYRLSFRFTAPEGFVGVHGFEVEPTAGGRARLRHVLEMRLEGGARWTWPLVFRWLHDALLEDLLDRAQAATEGQAVRPRRFGFAAAALRRLLQAVRRVR